MFPFYFFLKEGRIDIEILKIIKWYHIQEVLKNFSIGEQIVFERNIEKWRNEIGVPGISLFPSSLNELGTPMSCSSPNSSNRSQSLSPEPGDNVSISLSTILEQKNRGKQIIEFYKQNNAFQNHQRNMLVDLIANYFDENGITLSLATSHRLENEITQMFPTEKIEFYRIGKRGKVYFKYFNLKRLAKTLKPVKRKLPTPEKNQKIIFSKYIL